MLSIESIRTKIAENDLSKALDDTQLYIKQNGLTSYTNHIIGIQANWNELQQHSKKGTLSFDHITLYRNKIISGLNYWLDRIENEDPNSGNPDPIDQIKEQLKYVIGEITFLNNELLKTDALNKYALIEKIKEKESEKEKLFKRLEELEKLNRQ